MDASGKWVGEPFVALVSFAFLHAACEKAECRKELLSVSRELNVGRDVNSNGVRRQFFDDGDLETDGHAPASTPAWMRDLEPFLGLQRPVDVEAVQQVAADLRLVADQFEQNVMDQSARNLSRTLQNSPFNNWKDYLSSEVDRAMSRGVIPIDLAQEKVVLAVTLTLVKGVCELVPSLTGNLFNAMLQYINHRRAR